MFLKRKIETKLFILLLMVALTGCQKAWSEGAHLTDFDEEHHHEHHRPGGRPGLHGMTLFGNGPYYLAHIPMLTAPHDEQLILKATLLDTTGEPIMGNYSDEGFSVRPSGNFPLDDLASGTLTSFTGNIHRGNFEHGGALETAQVTFQIETILVSRQLPGQASTPVGVQQGYLFGTDEAAYIVNLITPDRSYQQIVKIQLDTLPDTFTDHSVLSISMAADQRLSQSLVPFQGTVLSDANTQTSEFVVEALAELWCLQGPDFFSPCN